MQAIVYHRYGGPEVLALQTLEKPTPKEEEVLIKVHAAAVNPLDWHYMRGEPYLVRLQGGLFKPKEPRLGADFAGRVEAVGSAVTTFKPGDEVYGVRTGAFGEYVCKLAKNLTLKPTNLTFAEAAAVPVAACTALQGLRDQGQIQAGHKVLINGAAGGVGTFAVQIAKAFGAEVTAVCSTRNIDLVHSLGADRVIDYTKENFTQQPQRYDLILDNVGNHAIATFQKILTPTGAYIIAGGPKGDPFLGPLARALTAALRARFSRQKLAFFMASANAADLLVLKDLIEAKKITPAIDRTYPLRETAEAIRYVETGHARAKVVINVINP